MSFPAHRVPLTKGPIWSAFDRFFSRADLDRRYDHKLEALDSLHRNMRFTAFDRESSRGLDVGALKDHINQDWFGFRRGNPRAWVAPPDPDPSRPETIVPTGQWKGWCGNAEGIVRETLIRAIEVSLGVPHLPWRGNREDALAEYGLERGKPPDRNWPIEFWCVGPLPWFQGSLTWRRDRDGGRVIVTWLVPSIGVPLVGDLAEGRSGFTVDPPNPTADDERFGCWIIGQAQTVNATIKGPDPNVAVSTGPPVVVSPNLASGGVDPCRED